MNHHTVSPIRLLALCVLLLPALTGFPRSTRAALDTPEISADGSVGTCYSNYGVHEGLTADVAPIMYSAGSRYDRIDFAWDRIEATPGEYDFTAYDRVVNLDTSSGLDVVGILQSTAHWATSGCPVSISALPAGLLSAGELAHPDLLDDATDVLPWCPIPPYNLYLPWDHPDNYWGRFVYQTVLHFKDRMHVWEIWNEPDWSAFWTGTPADYAQLLKVGYQAVKAADPGATVLFGGLMYWGNPDWYKQTLALLPALDGASASSYYFDVMSLHQYSSVPKLMNVVIEVRDAVAASVGSHPLWLTETGVPLCEEPGFPQVCAAGSYYARANEAASFAIEAYAEARAAGVSKFFWFRAHDELMTEAFGLLRNDLSDRPSYNALQAAASYLHGENQITGPIDNGTVRRVTFWGTPVGRIDTLWNLAGGSAIPYAHPAVMPTATLVDRLGATQTLTAEDGYYNLMLDPATAATGDGGAFIVGGPPVLLIQTDPDLPESALQSIPATLYSDLLTLAWDVTDVGSGYWYQQVETASAPGGPWTTFLDWRETKGVISLMVVLPHGGDWYFRSRARDNVGNWEAWPPSAEIGAYLVPTRTVELDVAVFEDADGDGVWDAGETAPFSSPLLTWRADDGTLIEQVIASTASWTRTLDAGDTVVEAALSGYFGGRRAVYVPYGKDPLVVNLTIGLSPVVAKVYLPLATAGE